jgi:hypothetical protein
MEKLERSFPRIGFYLQRGLSCLIHEWLSEPLAQILTNSNSGTLEWSVTLVKTKRVRI